jgi:hypothetical protein
MPLPSSGLIKLSDIQTEFGGSNPISLSEYYRNGLYTTNNNVGVATSGMIDVNSFHNTYKTSAISDIITSYKTTNYTLVRNVLISGTSFANGLESNTATSFDYSSSATYRYSTSVTGTFTWPTTFDVAFNPMLKTSYLTIIMRNVGNGTLTNSLTVNGTSQILTNIYNSGLGQLNVNMSYVQVPVGYAAMSNITVSATFTKGSSNNDNLQEIFIIPGKWDVKYSNYLINANVGASFSLGNVAVNDLVFGINVGGVDGYQHRAVYGGTSVRTTVLDRASKWYTDTESMIHTVDTAGTLTFNPGTTVTYGGHGGSTPFYSYFSGLGVIFTCSQV